MLEMLFNSLVARGLKSNFNEKSNKTKIWVKLDFQVSYIK